MLYDFKGSQFYKSTCAAHPSCQLQTPPQQQPNSQEQWLSTPPASPIFHVAWRIDQAQVPVNPGSPVSLGFFRAKHGRAVRPGDTFFRHAFVWSRVLPSRARKQQNADEEVRMEVVEIVSVSAGRGSGDNAVPASWDREITYP